MTVKTEDDAFEVIRSHRRGVLQSELRKMLDVDSRKCSRLVTKLIEDGRVERSDYRKDGVKTFLLRASRAPADPSLLLAGTELIPCVVCEHECVVEECPLLMDWMYQLAIEEIQE
ncbi:MAG: Lrp/AsnC family transcriptional regulator [Methanospirillum sp.]|nr:Lrp/AsnC family transcriptional regulator [Methanospirillum sp.]